MIEAETIKEFERDGFKVRLERIPDYDYRAGADDDIYPRLVLAEEVSEEETLGKYPGVQQGEYYALTHADTERLIKVAGTDDRDEFLTWAQDVAAALSNGVLSFVGIRATVYRAGVELASASLWGIEDDGRTDETTKQSRAYWFEVGDELAAEAIEEARKKIAALTGEAS